ncbi:MAB_1171c family putative transporter [Streptomyces sp. CAU 1734]|uniref:MAB_1171c family putative transporter n=1 Tax=Streptomyces sp. CAU 1734 TaxID=3140360 RepID=UPI003261B56A
MSDFSFYGPALLGGLAFLLRLPGLLRNPHDPLLRAVAVLLVTGWGVFFFGAIPTIAKVNELTGVPNFSAPLVYTILTAFSGSCIVLIINWRGGPPRRIRRATRWCIGIYSLVGVALCVLFALGEAPAERLRDLDTYYANTPYIREMIVLYLVTHTVSAIIMTALCHRWSRDVSGVLRTGLVLMVSGYLLTLVYDICKFAAVGARWAGGDWDELSTDVARPLASAASLFIATGLGLPLVVQRLEGPWRSWSRYRELGPLWRLLSGLTAGRSNLRMSPLSSVGVRLLQRESDIHDGLLALNPHFDPEVRAAALAAALAAGASPEDASARAEAAMVVAALEALAADPGQHPTGPDTAMRPGTSGHASCDRDLVRMSRALSDPPRRPAGRRSAGRLSLGRFPAGRRGAGKPGTGRPTVRP